MLLNNDINMMYEYFQLNNKILQHEYMKINRIHNVSSIICECFRKLIRKNLELLNIIWMSNGIYEMEQLITEEDDDQLNTFVECIEEYKNIMHLSILHDSNLKDYLYDGTKWIIERTRKRTNTDYIDILQDLHDDLIKSFDNIENEMKKVKLSDLLVNIGKVWDNKKAELLKIDL